MLCLTQVHKLLSLKRCFDPLLHYVSQDIRHCSGNLGPHVWITRCQVLLERTYRRYYLFFLVRKFYIRTWLHNHIACTQIVWIQAGILLQHVSSWPWCIFQAWGEWGRRSQILQSCRKVHPSSYSANCPCLWSFMLSLVTSLCQVAAH